MQTYQLEIDDTAIELLQKLSELFQIPIETLISDCVFLSVLRTEKAMRTNFIVNLNGEEYS